MYVFCKGKAFVSRVFMYTDVIVRVWIGIPTVCNFLRDHTHLENYDEYLNFVLSPIWLLLSEDT